MVHGDGGTREESEPVHWGIRREPRVEMEGVSVVSGVCDRRVPGLPERTGVAQTKTQTRPFTTYLVSGRDSGGGGTAKTEPKHSVIQEKTKSIKFNNVQSCED